MSKKLEPRGRVKLAITMGDPAGIGPEIIAKALACSEIYELCYPVVFGSVDVMRAACDRTGVEFKISAVNGYSTEVVAGPKRLLVWPTSISDPKAIVPGALSAEAGKAAAEAVIYAAHIVMHHVAAALVTAPINKEAIALGGYPYAGHTELLAELTRSKRYAMLLVAGNLRVIHLSTHVSMQEAISRVKRPAIIKCIRMGFEACQSLGIRNARIAVAGLNPHAGEHGLFGTEDAEEIAPAVDAAHRMGMNVSGPHPPDTVFARALANEFDLVVAMYHDQGHIPVKLSGIDNGVNISVGMPIIRVSVDHGTAFDIAGKGVAREKSMLEAIRTAVDMARRKFPWL